MYKNWVKNDKIIYYNSEFFRSGFPHSQDKRAGISKHFLSFSTLSLYIPWIFYLPSYVCTWPAPIVMGIITATAKKFAFFLPNLSPMNPPIKEPNNNPIGKSKIFYWGNIISRSYAISRNFCFNNNNKVIYSHYSCNKDFMKLHNRVNIWSGTSSKAASI